MNDNKTEKIYGKQRFNLRLNDEAVDVVKTLYKKDNCKSYSEFIEKAIMFYGGYVANDNEKEYLPSAFITTMNNIVDENTTRLSRHMFRYAVEITMIKNILAILEDIDMIDMKTLERSSIEEVRKINGAIDMEEAIKWQN